MLIVTSPVPAWATTPVPLTVFENVTASVRLKASVPLLATVVAALSVPLVEALPSCTVPWLIRRAPVNPMVVLNTALPGPVFVTFVDALLLLIEPPALNTSEPAVLNWWIRNSPPDTLPPGRTPAPAPPMVTSKAPTLLVTIRPPVVSTRPEDAVSTLQLPLRLVLNSRP